MGNTQKQNRLDSSPGSSLGDLMSISINLTGTVSFQSIYVYLIITDNHMELQTYSNMDFIQIDRVADLLDCSD